MPDFVLAPHGSSSYYFGAPELVTRDWWSFSRRFWHWLVWRGKCWMLLFSISLGCVARFWRWWEDLDDIGEHGGVISDLVHQGVKLYHGPSSKLAHLTFWRSKLTGEKSIGGDYIHWILLRTLCQVRSWGSVYICWWTLGRRSMRLFQSWLISKSVRPSAACCANFCRRVLAVECGPERRFEQGAV